MAYTIVKNDNKIWKDKFLSSFRPKFNWGPSDPALLRDYKVFKENVKNDSKNASTDNIVENMK